MNVCVIKTASVYSVQHNFSRVLAALSDGEPIVIKRRNVPVAKLVAIEKKSPELPNYLDRLDSTYGSRVVSDSQSILDELREERF